MSLFLVSHRLVPPFTIAVLSLWLAAWCVLGIRLFQRSANTKEAVRHRVAVAFRGWFDRQGGK